VTAKNAKATEASQDDKADKADKARARLASTGRNDPCPCGSGKKY
jgi:uncharacterized protein YecA (UPF0149 family)